MWYVFRRTFHAALPWELTIIGNRGVCGAVLIRDRLTATPLMTFVAHKRRETARQPRPEVLSMAVSARPLSLRGSTRFYRRVPLVAINTSFGAGRPPPPVHWRGSVRPQDPSVCWRETGESWRIWKSSGRINKES